MQHKYSVPFGRNAKPKPDTTQLKELAAAGKTKHEIAAAFGIKYKRLLHLLYTYESLNRAYTEGEKLYKEKTQNAEIKA
jgi:hypothetical protein